MKEEFDDLKKLEAATVALNRAESGEELLKVANELRDVATKLRRRMELLTLDAFERLKKLANEATDPEVREQAKQALARYDFLFPPETDT